MNEKSLCSRKLWFRHYYHCRPFPPPHLRVLEVHINGIKSITIHITESNIHISYSENHELTLFFYYFYMSPLPTLAHSIAKGNTFSISSSFDVTKLLLTNSMAYGTRRFNAAFTRALQ